MEFKKNGDVWDYIMTYADPEMPDKTYTFVTDNQIVMKACRKSTNTISMPVIGTEAKQ
jgi:hypothetical protein